MSHYSDLQLYSWAILVLFATLSAGKVILFLTRSPAKRFLKRHRSLKKLKKLSWEGFETLCLHFFSQQGWRVRGNETKGADGGVDLWMQKRRVKAIVQCKRYEDARVTVKVVREMYGLMHEYGADKAFVVTTSEFTKECYSFAEEKEIELINGEMLVWKIRQLI